MSIVEDTGSPEAAQRFRAPLSAHTNRQDGSRNERRFWLDERVVGAAPKCDFELVVLVFSESIDIRPTYRTGYMQAPRLDLRCYGANPVVYVLREARRSFVPNHGYCAFIDQTGSFIEGPYSCCGRHEQACVQRCQEPLCHGDAQLGRPAFVASLYQRSIGTR